MRRAGAAMVAALFASIGAMAPALAGTGATAKSPTLAETFIDLVSEAWTEDPALVALRAREKGYDLEQTLEAMGDEALAADGTITDEGRPVPPAGPAEGVLARVGEDEVSKAIARNEQSVAKSKFVKPPADVLENDTFMLVLLLGLMAEGYTLEQIILDGLMADGVRSTGPFSPIRIVDENDEVIEPGDAPADDAIAESVIDNMVAIVQGGDPLDPAFKPRYDVTYTAKLAIGDGTATVDAKGRLGTAPDGGDGDVYLGRLKGKIKVPAGDDCPGETVSIAIGLSGLEPDSGRTVEMDQTWAYTGSTGGSGGGSGNAICISAADAPELVGLLPTLLGPLYGVVAPGATLEARPATASSSASLTLKAKK